MVKRVCATSIFFLIFLFPSLRLFAQQSSECIECHRDKTLTKIDEKGNLHSLYVDFEKYLESVHGEEGLECVDCHVEARTDKHPCKGMADVDCGSCHDDVLVEFYKEKHGELLLKGDPDAPQCYDCHSMHYVFEGEDERSTLEEENCAITCGKCHEDKIEKKGFLARISSFRIKGHGKANLSREFSEDRCLDCHYEIGKHGGKEKATPYCALCHLTQKKASVVFGPIHYPKESSKSVFFYILPYFYIF